MCRPARPLSGAAFAQWHLKPATTDNAARVWPPAWPQTPLELRPTHRDLLRVAWWQTSVSLLLQVAQLLDIADGAFPSPHNLFSGSLLAYCTAVGDSLDSAPVFCAVARQWAYLQGYVAPPDATAAADTHAVAADALEWDRSMAAAHAAAFVPWRAAVLAAWPEDAFPARRLTVARDAWATTTVAPSTDDLAFEGLTAPAQGAQLAWWLRAAVGSPVGAAAAPTSAASAEARSPFHQRMAALTAISPSPERSPPSNPPAFHLGAKSTPSPRASPSSTRSRTPTDPAASAAPPAGPSAPSLGPAASPGTGQGRGRAPAVSAPSAGPAVAQATADMSRLDLSAQRRRSRFSESTAQLPIMAFADEVVERTRKQRLLCIQVRARRVAARPRPRPRP